MEETKFGCKYGLKCTKFETRYDIQKYYDMKKIMDNIDLNAIMSWSNARSMYRGFLLEHSKLYKYKDYRRLPADAKAHLKAFMTNRISVSDPNGELYRSAYKFYNNILEEQKKHKNIVSSKATKKGNSKKDPKGEITGGGSDAILARKLKAYKSTAKCQGLAKSNFAPYCKHVKKTFSGTYRPVYNCPDCHKYVCSNDIDQLRYLYNECRDFRYTNEGVYKPGKNGGNNANNNNFESWLYLVGKKIKDQPGYTSQVTGKGTGNGDGTGEAGADGAAGADGLAGSMAGGSGASGMPLRTTGFYGVSEYDPTGEMNKDKELIVRYTTLDEAKDVILDMASGAKDKFTDAFGNVLTSIATGLKNNFIPGYNSKGHIMGLPMFYNPICDPNARVFSENTLMDLPLVYIMPGKGIVNPAAKDEISDDIKDILLQYENNDFSGTIRNIKGCQDIRALAFEAAFEEYLDYFNNVASTVWGLLGLEGIFKWNKELGMAVWDPDPKQRALVYFAHSSTSATDSFQNTYGPSKLTEIANGASSLVREYKQLAGKDLTDSIFGFGSTNSTVSDNGGDSVTNGVNTGGGLFGTVESLLQNLQMGVCRVLNGTNLLFPQIWSDSSLDRSYNLSFRFYSPYGNKESLFENVYMPLLSLLVMTMPRMDNISGYAQPFYVRINVPGYFQSDMAVIESLTIEKGGDDKLWTIDGLPNEIEVTLTIRDMYSTIAMTKNSTLMAFNMGMTAYLDCMAGIRSDDLFNIKKFGGVLKNRMSKVYKGVGTGPGLWISEAWQSFLGNILN